jgi:IS1 family transposase
MALTNAEKQAAWRERREQRIKELERQVAELEAKNAKLRTELERAKRKSKKIT